ncbi:type III-A CRISPR-associated RAMP protein Csm3 [Caldovatus aquaticus]|uniref:CRISPR system Cms endoribonuclease Csm3 n=1 Tax=Caldovatus aquaticus TaxID=2865671 RepID=A0ABS7F2J0_9PROT|nr:type III-A CRISPR-associated RAMP protein Csm3 [Caldovatus aquaticus]MBW8269020.1 type III-A CRISPR-associated RAMP protein Csm3 [Caldovatus aquaticus]
MSEIRERGRVRVTGLIRLKSGLHIGAGKDSVEIGGIDNPVIKHPRTGEPYIPGSSLKGKLRFLLEWAFGAVREDGHAWGYNDRQPVDTTDPVLRIFGNALKEWKGGPTRLMVRDAPLCEADRARYREGPEAFFEEKTEVTINRIQGKALDGGLRTQERVPAGVAFDFEMAFRLYDLGDGGARDLACLNWTLQGLALLEEDALGGSGSRGYGRIAFEDLALQVPERAPIALDNRFRGHRFSRERPPAIVTEADVLGVPA